jgi:predicted outer membrane repeat protein
LGEGGGIFNGRGGTLTVTDCTLSGNSASSGSGQGQGGAIHNQGGGTLTVTDCTLSGNTATDGGGILSGAATLTVTGSVLSGNSATHSGGGIYNDGSMTITNSTLSGNSASFGGGIFNTGPGMQTVTGSTLSGNSASSGSDHGQGGGIFYGGGGTLTVTGCTLSGNSASGSGQGQGGGIFNIFNAFGGTLAVTDCTLSGNTANSGGGIYNASTLAVTDCTLSGNTADSAGGIYSYGTLAVTNSTFSGNSADFGAGGISNFGTLTVTDSTLSGNTGGIGGGIFAAGAIIRNTLLAGNRASFAPDVGGSVASQGHNLIGDGSGGSGFADTDLVGTAANPIDPRLGPLQDNGGPTQTMALLPGSPALDAGDPDQVGIPDQRGVVRSGGVNIGAYQASASAFALTAPDTVTAGVPFDVTVTAVDPFGQVAVGYTGTVDLYSTDAAAPFLGEHAFTLADGGSYTFTGVTLSTPGPQTLYAADGGGLYGSADLTVSAGEAPGVLGGARTGVPASGAEPGPAGYAFTAAGPGKDALPVTAPSPRNPSLFVPDRDTDAVLGDLLFLMGSP